MAEHILHLEAEIGVHQAQALAETLLEALARAQPGDRMVLDCTAVRALDTSIGQLLVAFLLEAQATDNPIHLRGVKAVTLFQAALGCDQFDGKTAHLIAELDSAEARGAS